MIAITCSACEKKLSVKDNLAGKKVKCPGCGEVTAVPAAEGVHSSVNEEMRTLPPAPLLDPSHEDARTIPPAAAEADSKLTNPPLSNPDHTMPINAVDTGHDSSLTDFLSPSQADDELGRLGKYRILKILGHGGMGVVYKAEDPRLKRTVAIKAMLPTLAASANSGKRFLREAQAMAAVKHDHIVGIFDVDEDRGVPFMAMEFLEGEPLDERLKRHEELPLAEMLRIGREIARGLAAAHRRGLIHRDIKPANIWIEAPEDRVRILDFGLARASSQDAGLTQQGSIIGTPSHMAPEQGRGDDVDARCDLFSLGVVLYRMCTGQQPFVGKDTISTLMAVAMHDPMPPQKLNAKLPQELSDLIMHLLEKDPAKRTASADDVVKALQSMERELIRKKESTEDTIGTAFTPPKKAASAKWANSDDTQTIDGAAPRRRSKLPRVLAALALLALLGGGGMLAVVVYFWQTNNGIVRIEINDPDIKVAFDTNGPTVSGVDKQDIKLTPGEFGLHVERGDLKFDTDKFILKKGETITLKIEWFKEGKLQVVQGDKVLGEKSLQLPAPLPSRQAYALQLERQTIPLDVGLELSRPFTVEAWVTSVGGGSLFHRHLQTGLNVSGESCEFVVRGQKPNEFSINRIAFKGAVVGPTHVAGVFSGKEIRLFVAGKLAGSKSTELNPPHPGAASLLLTNTFSGMLTEVRISTVARYDKDFTPQKRFEPDADTLALYHCDEGAGDELKDASGNGHHGKIVGAKWVKAEGSPIALAADNALFFDGMGGHVDLPSLTYGTSEPITLEGYFQIDLKTDAMPSAGPFNGMRIFGNAKGNGGQGLALNIGRDRILLAMAGQQALSRSKLDTRWHHLALCFTGQRLTIYADGKRVGETSELNKSATPKLPIRLAAPPEGTGKHFFAGKMREIRISKIARYDKDFTPAQRFEPDADTLALYHFDEGAGNMLKDSSGNNHHGKIVAAKWVKADGLPVTSVVPLPKDASPFDPLHRADIPAYELKVAGEGDPAKAPAELVAVLGDSHWRHWANQEPGYAHDLFLEYSHDGSRLLTAGACEIKLWDVATGEEIWTLQLPQLFLYDVRFSRDDRLIAVGGNSATLVVEASTGKVMKSRKERSVYVAFTKDSDVLVMFVAGKMVLWDARADKIVREFPTTLNQYPSGLDVSPDGKLLAVTMRDGGWQLLETATGKPVRAQQEKPKTPSRNPRFTPSGDRVFTFSSEPPGPECWETKSGKRIFALETKEAATALGGSVSSDGQMVATLSSEGKAHLWKATNGQHLNMLDPLVRSGYANGSCAFRPDGKELAGASGHTAIRFWDRPGGRLRPLPGLPLSGVRKVMLLDSGRRLLVDGLEGILIFEVPSWKVLVQIPAAMRSSRFAVSRDDRMIATLHVGEEGFFGTKVWDSTSGKMVKDAPRVSNTFASGTFTADGEKLIIQMGTGGVLTLWDWRKGIQEASVDLEKPTNVWSGVIVLSPDGRQVACGSEHGLLGLAHADTLKRSVNLEGALAANGIAFSPDGNNLASTGNDAGNHCLRTWEVATGKKVLNIPGLFEAPAYSPDGTTLAVRRDQQIVFLNPLTGKERRPPVRCRTSSLAWAPDGRHLLAGNGTGTVYVFRLPPMKVGE